MKKIKRIAVYILLLPVLAGLTAVVPFAVYSMSCPAEKLEAVNIAVICCGGMFILGTAYAFLHWQRQRTEFSGRVLSIKKKKVLEETREHVSRTVPVLLKIAEKLTATGEEAVSEEEFKTLEEYDAWTRSEEEYLPESDAVFNITGAVHAFIGLKPEPENRGEKKAAQEPLSYILRNTRIRRTSGENYELVALAEIIPAGLKRLASPEKSVITEKEKTGLLDYLEKLFRGWESEI